MSKNKVRQLLFQINSYEFTYEDPRDAEEAHYKMARQRLFGREIEVEFARGDRKSKWSLFIGLLIFKRLKVNWNLCSCW